MNILAALLVSTALIIVAAAIGDGLTAIARAIEKLCEKIDEADID